jgi:hypothetical protein
VSEAPEAEDSQDGDNAEGSLEGTSSTMLPPPAHLEDLGLDRKRKYVEELLSSCTSAPKNVAAEASAGAKLTCSRRSLCVVNNQPVGNPKRKV